ncbi:MAG TPA: MFS transporter [Miltoncostaeaceae bacterium]|nr:MFS transporter [Miltoncostaeaceae bacterium]
MVPAVLRYRAFRDVWLASLASNAGSWLQIVASGWLILQLTDSPAAVGALALVTRAPAILLSTVAGQLADRFDRRAVGIWTFLLQAVAAGALALITWASGPEVWSIYVLTFLVGVGFALGLPAMLALIPALVPAPRLSQAVSLNAAGINVARLAGPAIGGATLALFGATACFALNAVSFLALVLVLLRIPARPAPAVREGVGMRAALAYAAGDDGIRRLLIGMAVFTALASPIQELAPVVADRLDAGPEGLGLLLGAMGGGALAGAWLLERLHGGGLPRHRALPIATLTFSAGLAVVALTPWLWLGLLGMAFSGAFWIWMFAATNTAIQLRSPRPLLGRMLGLYQLSVIGPIAIGSAVAGAVAERAGIAATLAACAALLAAWGAWSLRNPGAAIDAQARANRAIASNVPSGTRPSTETK